MREESRSVSCRIGRAHEKLLLRPAVGMLLHKNTSLWQTAVTVLAVYGSDRPKLNPVGEAAGISAQPMATWLE